MLSIGRNRYPTPIRERSALSSYARLKTIERKSVIASISASFPGRKRLGTHAEGRMSGSSWGADELIIGGLGACSASKKIR